MSDPLIEKALNYLTEWQTRLHLTDWSVKVQRGETSRDDWIAANHTNWRDHVATIIIAPTYEERVTTHVVVRRYTDLDREIEATILHELLHIAWSPRTTDVRDALDEVLAERAQADILSALEKAEEWAVNIAVRALLDQKYLPGGLEKSSDQSQTEPMGHPWPYPGHAGCPDCDDLPTPSPSIRARAKHTGGFYCPCQPCSNKRMGFYGANLDTTTRAAINIGDPDPPEP